MREIKLLSEDKRKKLFVRTKEGRTTMGEHTHLEFYDEDGKELFYMQFSETVINIFGPLSNLDSPNMLMKAPGISYRRD